MGTAVFTPPKAQQSRNSNVPVPDGFGVVIHGLAQFLTATPDHSATARMTWIMLRCRKRKSLKKNAPGDFHGLLKRPPRG
jgi:hypothetical protein